LRGRIGEGLAIFPHLLVVVSWHTER
jgi:hypothetical protein